VVETKARTNLPPNPKRGDLAQWDGYEWRKLSGAGDGTIPIFDNTLKLHRERYLQPGDVPSTVATGWNVNNPAGSLTIPASALANLNGVYYLPSTGGTYTVTLPAAAAVRTQLIVICGGFGHDVTVNCVGSDVFLMPDGSQPASLTLRAGYAKLHLIGGAGFNYWTVVNPEPSLTTDGDILYRAAGRSTRLPVGSNGQVLKVAGGLPTYAGLVSTDLSDFNEAAQDAVGNALVDSATIDFTYNDAANQITAAVLPAGLFPAWTAYTPLVAPSAGSLGSYTLGACRYLLLGKLCIWQAITQITNVGSGSGAVLISLPFNLNAGAAWGRESAVTGQMLYGTASGNLIICSTYNNGGTVFTNWQLLMTGVFETT